MMGGHFSNHALSFVEDLLGECNQKQKREAKAQPRTQAQQQADQARSQALRGKDTISSGSRSAAAKKAAETRNRCKGNQKPPTLGVK